MPWVREEEAGEVFPGPLARAHTQADQVAAGSGSGPWVGGQFTPLPGASFGARLLAAEDTRLPACGGWQGSTLGQASPALISGLFLLEASAMGQFSWEQICGAVPI